MKAFPLIALAMSVVSVSALGCSRKEETSTVTTTAAAAAAPAVESPAPAAAKGPFSCDQRKEEYFEDTCIDFTGDSLKRGEAALKRGCGGSADGKAVFAASACPKEGVVLSCEADKEASVWRYYGAGKNSYTAASAKEKCTAIDGKVL
ncbi:MAG TPA: hypothetical protein VGI39_00530 [Polyangiaceae bacterium]